MQDPVFSYFSPFHGNGGNDMLLFSGNRIVIYEDSTSIPTLYKDSFDIDGLRKLVDRLGLRSEFNKILIKEGNRIVLNFYFDSSKDKENDFILVEALEDGVVGRVLDYVYVYVPFVPTNEILELSLSEVVYTQSNNNNLNDFLDYHFDYSPVNPTAFFDYLADFTKRRLTLDTSFNVKPARIILEWLRSKSANVTELDIWFKKGNHTILPTLTQQLSLHSAIGAKLQWKGDKTDLAELIWTLCKSERIMDTTTGKPVTQKELVSQLITLLGLDTLDVANLMKYKYGTKSKTTSYKAKDGKTFPAELQNLLLSRVLD